LARGHRVEQTPELPLVLDDSIQAITKTKKAVELLTAIGASNDTDKVRESKKLRAGKGKLRGRRYTSRRGPLVIYKEDQGVTRAFRNIPGVEICHVDRLNLLQLAPGGHLGRFIIWTKSAFTHLDQAWGSWTRTATTKKNYHLPRNLMFNSDLNRLINSDEIQSKLKPAKLGVHRAVLKRNPLTNLGAMIKLNPYALTQRRNALRQSKTRSALRATLIAARREKKTPVITKLQLKEQTDKKARSKKHSTVQHANYNRMLGPKSAFFEEKKEEKVELPIASATTTATTVVATPTTAPSNAPSKAPSKDAPKDPKKDAPKDGKKDAPKDGKKDAPKDAKKDAPKDGKKDGKK